MPRANLVLHCLFPLFKEASYFKIVPVSYWEGNISQSPILPSKYIWVRDLLGGTSRRRLPYTKLLATQLLLDYFSGYLHWNFLANGWHSAIAELLYKALGSL